MQIALFEYLRPRFMICFFIVWNAIFLVGIYLNGGTGSVKSVPAALVMSIALAGLVVFSFGSLLFGPIRRLVLRPEAQLSDAWPGLLVSGMIGSVLLVAALMTAAGRL